MAFRDNKIQGGWLASNSAAASGGVSATKTGVAGETQMVTGIQCSSDAAALVTIQTPSGTTVWRKRFAAAFNMSENFQPGVITAATGDTVLVNVSASASNVEANINGYTI